jgi:predicted CXXCH cytochrome family protein
MLRATDDPAGLCTTCHAPSADRASQHALGVPAHLGTPARSRRLAIDMDVESAGCVSCHDGSMVMDPGHLGQRSTFQADAHPIGATYRSGRGGGLRPSALLDERIRLFDDRIGCGSCHSPYSPEPSLLVMSNQGSALCLDCHDY